MLAECNVPSSLRIHPASSHDLVLESSRRFPNKTALIDTSNGRRMSYAEYGQTVESLARGLISAGLTPGDVVAIFCRIPGSSARPTTPPPSPEVFQLS